MRTSLAMGLLFLGGAAHAAAGQSLSRNDYTEIHGLYARYAQAADSSNGEAYGGVFTSDGVFVIDDKTGALGGPGGVQTFTGSKAISALMRGPRREHPKVTHFYSNIVVDPTPDGAKGSVYVILIDLQKNPAITGGGVCEDVLTRTKDGWRFRKRVCYVEPKAPQASAVSSSR